MADPAGVAPPVVIDLGKVRRKRIKQLKRGRGRLVDEVREVAAEATERLGAGAEGKQIIPIVVVYRRKPRKARTGLPFLW